MGSLALLKQKTHTIENAFTTEERCFLSLRQIKNEAIYLSTSPLSKKQLLVMIR